jgi:ABC-type amino acid transport substrate-binding protein
MSEFFQALTLSFAQEQTKNQPLRNKEDAMKTISKLLTIGLVAVCCLSLVAVAARADETMDRIEKTGKIRVGWREGSIPFAYVDPKVGKQVGFSVDMTYELVNKLSEHFGKKIEIEPYTVTPQTRIPMVANRTIDVEMGSTTYTQKREDVVDFSMIFFFSETTFLVPKNSPIHTMQDLNGMRLGAARGTTNLQAIERDAAQGLYKPKEVVVVETHPQGFLALQSGKIDAYSTDRSLLEGLRMKAPHPDDWRTVNFAIAYEPYGYMMRKCNSDFRHFLDDTIRWSVKTGKFFELYDKWMGPKGPVPIPMSAAYKNYLEMMVYPMEDNWWKKP